MENNSIQILVLWNYQFSIAPVVQYKILRFKVSVDDSFGMQVGKGFHHTGCVKPGCWVLKGTPAEPKDERDWLAAEKNPLYMHDQLFK